LYFYGFAIKIRLRQQTTVFISQLYFSTG